MLLQVNNADLRSDAPWSDILWHDFWGQNISELLSHKSYRPLATASLRVNRILANWFSSTDARIGGVAGMGPALYYHLGNLLLHGAMCAVTVLLFQRSVFSGQLKPAVLAAMLYTVHPVHVEAVAALVGRADLLAGLCTIVALLLFANRKQSTAAFLTAIIFSIAAAASKETGVTVLGVMCAWEAVDWLERYLWPLKAAHSLPYKVITAWDRMYMTEGLTPMLRVAACVASAAAIVFGHVRMHQGAPLRPWGILENDIAIMPR